MSDFSVTTATVTATVSTTFSISTKHLADFPEIRAQWEEMMRDIVASRVERVQLSLKGPVELEFTEIELA